MLHKLLSNSKVCAAAHKLVFDYSGEIPRAGQFFLIKPERTSVFLARPFGVFTAKPLSFVVEIKGRGTKELCALKEGESAELTGPLGNSFFDFLTEERSSAKKPALVSGGAGAVPIFAFSNELKEKKIQHDFFAGFKSRENNILRDDENSALIVTEAGDLGEKGIVTGFVLPEKYSAVFSCGPRVMMEALSKKCAEKGTPCFVSMENKMACGTGACLGCTLKTKSGNKRCCKDGPVFDSSVIEWRL